MGRPFSLPVVTNVGAILVVALVVNRTKITAIYFFTQTWVISPNTYLR